MVFKTQYHFDKDELFDLYINQQLSTVEIAKIKNCSQHVILQNLRKFKITRRKTDGHKGIDYAGKRYGKLIVLEKTSKRKHGHVTWICQCNCGSLVEKNTYSLNRKSANFNCGCGKDGYRDLKHHRWLEIKRNAKKRNLEFSIDAKYAWEVLNIQKFRCRFTKVDLFVGENSRDRSTASLDRIDSSKGYVEGNVQWVHKTINSMKMAMADAEFVEWCKRVVECHQE